VLGDGSYAGLGFPRAELRIIFRLSAVVEHGQELVRRAEPTGPKRGRRGNVEDLELLGRVRP